MKNYINECKKLFDEIKPNIIISGNKKTFNQFNYLEELNNSSEIYSYSGISNSVGYFNDYLIEYKINILFNEMDILSLEKHSIPFILSININTLRFLNFSLNTDKGIKLLIGYFYSTCKVLNQLYKYGINDSSILYYFNVNNELKFNTDSKSNIFYSEDNYMLAQNDFYIKYRNYIHHKYQRWIKDAIRIKDDTKNVIRIVLVGIKNNLILNSIYKQLYNYNSITNDELKQFFILDEVNKVKEIRNLLINEKINVPYFLTNESIYSLIFDELKRKYDCKTFSQNYIDDFLSEYKIKLKSNSNYDIIEVKIKLLIKQELYQKGKLKEICNYLNISENTFRKIITLKNLPKPYQPKIESNKYTEYFNKNYTVKVDYVHIPKKEKVYENNNSDSTIIEDVDFLSLKKEKKVQPKFKWSQRNDNIDWNLID